MRPAPNLIKTLAASALLAGTVVSLTACQSSAPFPTTLRAVEQTAPARVTLDIREWRTEEGARVLFVPAPTLPMLDVRLTFDAGSARDGDTPGLASLTSALIGEGAGSLTVDDIARGFEDLGASFSTSSLRDMGMIELRSLTDPDYLEPALRLFLQVIGEPSFPQDALDRVRQQTLIGLARSRQVPGPQVRERYDAAVFAGHPYAHRSSGTEASLPGIRRADLAAFHRQYYSAANAVIALVGDLDEVGARQLAARISAVLPSGERAPRLERVLPQQQALQEHLPFDSSQTHILIGQQTIWRGHPDWVPLYVGNEILGGGGFASILTEEVRQKRGFVYGISSHFQPMASGGPFTIQLQTATDNADEALQLTLKLVRDFIDQGPSDEQLQAAIDSITGSSAQNVAENRQIVSQLAHMGFYDLPLDYLEWFDREVRAVTRDRIRDAFARNLNMDTLQILSIGRRSPVVAPQDEAPATP
jgi:zinc protease